MKRKSRALFLDRDGVVNTELNYVGKIEDFIFVEGIFSLCKKFQKQGYKIFIVTNQAGLARGFYTVDDFFILTEWMISEFLKNGIKITKVYFCPHHPDITGHCNCRKPNIGLIKQAEMEFDLDLSTSILIGDKISDIIAGKNAGVSLNILINPNILPKSMFRSIIE